jgi:hypothetical protein
LGRRIDIPLEHTDKLYATREFTEAEKQQDFILEPFEPLTAKEICDLRAAENRSILATFLP